MALWLEDVWLRRERPSRGTLIKTRLVPDPHCVFLSTVATSRLISETLS